MRYIPPYPNPHCFFPGFHHDSPICSQDSLLVLLLTPSSILLPQRSLILPLFWFTSSWLHITLRMKSKVLLMASPDPSWCLGRPPSPASVQLPPSSPALSLHITTQSERPTVLHLPILVLLLGMAFCFLSSLHPPFLFSGPFLLSFKTTEESLH